MTLSPACKDRLLWGLLATAPGIAAAYLLLESRLSPLAFNVLLLLPVLFSAPHVAWALGRARGALFAAIAGATGLSFEAFSLNCRSVFGASYRYNEEIFGLLLFKVPLLVVLYWILFIYTGYMVGTSFLLWLGKRKPHRSDASFWPVLVLVVLDGLAITSIDLFMEPLQAHDGQYWTWNHDGPAREIPLGNYFGWFLVATIATGAFRTFEYFAPRVEGTLGRSAHAIPACAYGVLALAFCVYAVHRGVLGLAATGMLAMLSVAAANLALFLRCGRSGRS